MVSFLFIHGSMLNEDRQDPFSFSFIFGILLDVKKLLHFS